MMVAQVTCVGRFDAAFSPGRMSRQRRRCSFHVHLLDITILRNLSTTHPGLAYRHVVSADPYPRPGKIAQRIDVRDYPGMRSDHCLSILLMAGP
jgi:hypothetical protein